MFSFKINKKSSSAVNTVQKNTQQISKKAFRDEEDVDDEEPDFIRELDGNTIVSKKQKKVEKKELVIPLITKNEWRIDKRAEKGGNEEESGGKSITKSSADSSAGIDESTDAEKSNKGEITNDERDEDSIKRQAIQELLEGSSSAASGEKNVKILPILFQNRVPDGYEEEDNMDVSLRPEQSTLDDYERIPIEDFGLAMLRGMGWKETEGIGLKNKKVVNMAEPKLRPKGMGLGAEAAHMQNKDIASKHASQQNGDDKEDLSFKIGGYAMITRGSKKGYYGQIESFDEDNNRVILRLAISGKMEAVSKFYVNIVPSKEYKKSSKVINREKYEEFKIKQEERSLQNEHRGSDHRNSSSVRNSRSRSRSSEERETKGKSRRVEREERSHKSERRSGHKHHRERSRSKERKDDKYREKHSKKYDERRYDRDDDYERSSSKHSDRDKKSNHRSSKRDDDRRREYSRD